MIHMIGSFLCYLIPYEILDKCHFAAYGITLHEIKPQIITVNDIILNTP